MTAILGLDLGKVKSTSCSYDPNTREACRGTVATDPRDLVSGWSTHKTTYQI